MKRFIITNLLSAVAIGMMACSWVDTHNYYLFSVCSHEEFSDRCNKLTLQNWRAYMGLDEEYYYFDADQVVESAQRQGDALMVSYVRQLQKYLKCASEAQQDTWDYPTKAQLADRSRRLLAIRAYAQGKLKTRLRSQHALLLMRCNMMLGRHSENVRLWEGTTSNFINSVYKDMMKNIYAGALLKTGQPDRAAALFAEMGDWASLMTMYYERRSYAAIRAEYERDANSAVLPFLLQDFVNNAQEAVDGKNDEWGFGGKLFIRDIQESEARQMCEFAKQVVKEGKTQTKWHPVSRPAEAEAEAVSRLLYLAKAAGEAPVYVVHLSTRKGLEEIRKAKAAGQAHFGAETCPQYLLLDEQMYEDPQEGLKALMAPPLRRQEDRDALWQALAGDELDTVATDHCPFTFAKQKQQGAQDFTKCPSGAPGVEERLILLYSEGAAKGRITLPQLVKYACANPARVAGLYPKKGVIEAGADADLVILDPEKEWTMTTEKLHGNADYTCYEGMKIKGAVKRVLLRGKTVALNGQFTGERGGGQYLRRGISSLAE